MSFCDPSLGILLWGYCSVGPLGKCQGLGYCQALHCGAQLVGNKSPN